MSPENEPRYQSPKTDEQTRKNPIHRLRAQSEQQTNAKLDSLQGEIERDRRELIALVDREIAEGKKEGRVVVIAGREVVVRMINTKGETRYYFFTRLSEKETFVGVVIAKNYQENKTMVVMKGHTINANNASHDRQGIQVNIYDNNQYKLISEREIDPTRETDAYRVYDQMTPNLKEIREDIEKNKAK